jgi:nicotinate-nucleotide adenylyltransferase
MKKTALFFGSFNPVHVGHLALANYIAEFTDVDEVRFIVSPHNPLKDESELLDDSLRLEMLRRSISGYSKFSVSDIEFSLPKPSFTFQTLSVLSQQEPDTQFILIIGGDNVDIFDKWKNYEWIMENYHILVYPRIGATNQIPDNYSNMTHINAPIIEISSTFIRESIRAGKDIRFFLPEAACQMMMEQQLYF